MELTRESGVVVLNSTVSAHHSSTLESIEESALLESSKKYEAERCQMIELSPASLSDFELMLLGVHRALRPKPIDYEHRKQLLSMVNMMTQRLYGVYGDIYYGPPVVEAFGSFIMDMFTPASDLDLSLNFNSGSTLSPVVKKTILRRFHKILFPYKKKKSIRDVTSILMARVPIIKFSHCDTGVECDVSVENNDGVLKSFILFLISSIDERLQMLSFLVKAWAKEHEINSARDRTLNSLSWILLVVFHLQTREPPILPPLSALLKGGTELKQLKDAVHQFKNYGSANKETVAELFIALLNKLLAVEALWEQGLCASTYTGSWISKSWASGIASISVEDFTDRTQNCARAVQKGELKKIYTCVRDTLHQLSLYAGGQLEASDLMEFLFGTVTSPADKQEVILKEVPVIKRKLSSRDSVATDAEAGAGASKKSKKSKKKGKRRRTDTAQLPPPTAHTSGSVFLSALPNSGGAFVKKEVKKSRKPHAPTIVKSVPVLPERRGHHVQPQPSRPVIATETGPATTTRTSGKKRRSSQDYSLQPQNTHSAPTLLQGGVETRYQHGLTSQHSGLNYRYQNNQLATFQPSQTQYGIHRFLPNQMQYGIPSFQPNQMPYGTPSFQPFQMQLDCGFQLKHPLVPHVSIPKSRQDNWLPSNLPQSYGHSQVPHGSVVPPPHHRTPYGLQYGTRQPLNLVPALVQQFGKDPRLANGQGYGPEVSQQSRFPHN